MKLADLVTPVSQICSPGEEISAIATVVDVDCVCFCWAFCEIISFFLNTVLYYLHLHGNSSRNTYTSDTDVYSAAPRIYTGQLAFVISAPDVFYSVLPSKF